MKTHNRCYIFEIMIISLLLLTGCQPSPQKEIVASKKNDSLNTSSIVTVEENQVPTETQYIDYNCTFDSTDKSIHFTIDIAQAIPATALSTVQVKTHYLTEEDAKRVANALFPETDFYEAEPILTPLLTKSEIQEKINLWSQYTNIDTLRTLYGTNYSDEYLYSTADLVKDFIEEYTLKYENAPQEVPVVPCAWKMRKSSEYMYSEDELLGMDLSDDNDEISAQCNVQGIPYYYSISTRNKPDFKVNMISGILFSGQSPRSIEHRILSAKLCRTSPPTTAQLEQIKEKATKILSNMELGQWQIDECRIEETVFGEQIEYNIFINAVPVFNGTPAIRCQQLESLRNQNGYAASQYYTDANFNFTANGELITFYLYTPLDIEEVISEHTKTIEIDLLLERAQDMLKLTDAYSYSFGSFLPLIDEPVQCNISISEFEYGLSRVKIHDLEDSYYYVPAIQFKGNLEYVGKTSGKAYYVSEEPELLIHINAVDGTIINETNS